MKVYVHIYHECLCLDETPYVEVEMPCELMEGDAVWLSDEQLDALKKPLIDNFDSDKVFEWKEYLYCGTAIRLDRGEEYTAITKEEFAADLDFGDARKVKTRLINVDRDYEIPIGLHIELSKH